MSVYVDNLIAWGWVTRGRKTESCHLIADSLEELHEFAAKIGMKRQWFQGDGTIPHYDLTPIRRSKAVSLGAVELDRKGFVLKIREHKAAVGQSR